MPGRPRVPRPEIQWERLPLARGEAAARDWLEREAGAGLSAATIDAYSRAVERFLAYCRERRIRPSAATTEHLAEYLRELAAGGLGPAARQQRLAALRLFYAFVVERGLRRDNPAVTPPRGQAPAASGDVRRGAPAPDGQEWWIPDEDEWLGVLEAAGAERPRTRVMLALAYDAALRREELCGLRPVDLDLRRRTVRVVPAVGTGVQMRKGRLVPLSTLVAEQCAAYLRGRAPAAEGGGKDREGRGPESEGLFLSESPRNRAEPITIWTWSKVVQAIGRRAGVARFTTHTPRHLRLTDLARAGWNAAGISRFAGHLRRAAVLPYFRLAREVPGPPGTDVVRHRDDQLARVLFRLRG